MAATKQQFDGIKTFFWIWAGQMVSMLGTGMTRFALLIWAYQQSGSATTLALLGFFSYLPFIVLAPFAGVLVDRWNRRLVLLFADLLAACLTGVMLILYGAGDLHIWHLYLVELLTGAFDAFQRPAFMATISVLMPREQYSRANGMLSLSSNGAQVFAPLLGGILLAVTGIQGVMIIDLVTFFASLGSLLFTRIPNPPQSVEGKAAGGRLWEEVRFGFRYIFRHPGLRSLMATFLIINLLASLTYFSILPAMILARSGGKQAALATVQSMLGIGGIVGAALVSAWGSPKRKARGVMVTTAASFLLGDLLFATGRSLPVWTLAAFLSAVFIPFISGWAQAIWQLKVPLDLQGRIFATKDMLQNLVAPVGFLCGGLLADHIFEPLMHSGAGLAQALNGLVGAGSGAGMGVMFLCTGILGTATGLVGLFSRPINRLDKEVEEMAVQPETVEAMTGD